MKKVLTILTILLAVLLTFSCQKELPDAIKAVSVNTGGQTPSPSPAPTPTPTPELNVTEPMQFDAKGGEQSITVTATEAWTASKKTGNDWLTIKPESGSAGTTQVALTATENETIESRKDTITIKVGELTKMVEISQSGANPEMSLNLNHLEFTSEGGIKSFKITTNTSWTVSSDQTWCTLSTTSGSYDVSIKVMVAENMTTSDRTATITVKAELGELTVKVTQIGAAAAISLSVNSLNFTSDSDSKSFTITSNSSWTVSSSQTWCTVSPSSGSNNGSVIVKVEKNKATSSRTATISVKSDAGDKIVNISQAGADAVLSLNVSSLDFTSAANSKTFKITSNTSWSVSSNQTWCTVSPSSGANDGNVTVQVEGNTSTSVRKAIITVRSEAGNKTVIISQASVSPTLSLSTSSLGFSSTGSGQSFNVLSNTSWTVSSNKSWCTVQKTSGSGDGSVTIWVSENTSTSARTATVTVAASTISRSLSVTQSGAEVTPTPTPIPTPIPSTGSRTFSVGDVTFKMIAVEGGTFTMGATSEQGSDADDREKPTHSVTLSSYSIGETEVTQALWQTVMGQKPANDGYQWDSTFGLGGGYPAYYVSWNDCQNFIRRLNALTGENFRLPTEAEWEFAARGGNKSRGYKYAGSNNIDIVAWYDDNSGSLCQTHIVGTKSPNELGLYDMSGNVREWCQDWYGYYSSSSQTNPTGPGSGYYRVNRGGNWCIDAWFCRVSCRSYNDPTHRYDVIGLRLAL